MLFFAKNKLLLIIGIFILSRDEK